MNNDAKQKKYQKPLKDLTLLDRFLFDTAMENPDFCQNVLDIILSDQKISEVTIGIAEKSLESYYDSRAVRLDLLAFDDKDTVYDAEAQKENKGTRVTVRRSRLYQAHIDVNLLAPGETNFGKLNDTYVIFICPFDLFGYKKFKYTFHMTCDEIPGLLMDDGATRIFLNTHGQNTDEVSAELVELLHYMEYSADYSEEIVSPRVRQLAKQVDDLKSSQEVGVKYMKMLEELNDARDEGRTEGRTEGRAEGRTEGRYLTLIAQVRRNLEKGHSLEMIADFAEETLENIKLISSLICEYPDSNDDDILVLLKEKWM